MRKSRSSYTNCPREPKIAERKKCAQHIIGKSNGARPVQPRSSHAATRAVRRVSPSCGRRACRGRAPLCRAELPPGVDGLFDLAYRAAVWVQGMVRRGEASWTSLPAAEREEMDEAVAMLTEAGAQGHLVASFNLGVLLENFRRDFDGAEAAYRAAIGAKPGHANTHQNLGNLLLDQRGDFDAGAEAAYRAAIAAEPGHANAHFNLGNLLLKQRGDIDGAEAAYRAAIALEPGHAHAHQNLANLLRERAQQAKRDDSLEAAAALFDEVAKHYTIVVGPEHDVVKSNKTVAARLRDDLRDRAAFRERSTNAERVVRG